MKKLLITLTALVVTLGTAQAVAVAWNSGAIKDPVTGNNIGATDGIYLATVYFYLDDAGTIPFIPTGTLTDSTSNGKTSVFNGVTGPEFDLGTYYAQIVIESTDGIYRIASDLRSFALISTLSDGSINFGSGTGFNDGLGNASWTTAQAANPGTGGWEVIPEPATAGLLALGLAAVALRRRRVA